tara:strand:- start:103 stop:882 length:780 start_codon:yes stop_codon:yes gene_type:complete
MLLVIDCGNTNIVFALSKNEKIVKQWRINTNIKRTADEYSVWLIKLLEIENLKLSSISSCIIASVVPEVLLSLKIFNEKYLNINPMVIGEHKLELGIEINIETPSEAGADRLVNAVAVKKFYQKSGIVVDFGTATTFDVVSKNGSYEGGVIAPGVNLSLEALYMAASRLPRININNPFNKNVIGKNTKDSMSSGIYWGYISLIEGIIEKIKRETKTDYVVIATGGLSNLFSEDCNAIQVVDEDLTINGLIHIYNINNKK